MSILLLHRRQRRRRRGDPVADDIRQPHDRAKACGLQLYLGIGGRGAHHAGDGDVANGAQVLVHTDAGPDGAGRYRNAFQVGFMA